MRKLATTLCALIFLSSYDDKLELVSRDLSMTLRSINDDTAVMGKSISCTPMIPDPGPDNGDQMLTRFEVGDGDDAILVDNNEHSPEETSGYDSKVSNRLDLNFVPAVGGKAYVVIGIVNELVTRSDSIRLKIFNPEIGIHFQNVPGLILIPGETEFYLQLDTELYRMKVSARSVKGSGRVHISGYDATRDEGVALEKDDPVTFQPDATGQAVIESTISSHYGLSVKGNVAIQINQ